MLGDVLELVGDDGARVVLVEGPAGIGKTEVVRQFVAHCHGLRVLWADGDRAEPAGSFALIGRLLGAIGVRPPGARAAGMLAVERPVEVGRRILQALTGLGREDPVVLVVDDAHRVDRDSLLALLFALRRLSAYPVLTIVVRRPGEGDLPEGLVRLGACDRTGLILPLVPLQPVEVQKLAEEVGLPGVAFQAARRMCAHALGNPGHVLALLAELPVEVWGRESVLPAPRTFSRAVGRRLAACGDGARSLVEAVSVLGEHADLRTAGVLAGVGEPLVALEEACSAGLLTPPLPGSVWRVSFPDSLVRAAVYWQLGPAGRARLQRAAIRWADDEAAVLRRRDVGHAGVRRVGTIASDEPAVGGAGKTFASHLAERAVAPSGR